MRFSADSSEYSHFIVNELIWNLLAAADNERGNNDADNGGHLNTFWRHGGSLSAIRTCRLKVPISAYFSININSAMMFW